MNRRRKRLLSAAICLMIASALLAPLVTVLASGIPDIHSIIHSPTTPYTDSAWFSSGSLAPADWYSDGDVPDGYYPTSVILDLSQGVSQSQFGTAPLRENTAKCIDGVHLIFIGADCDALTSFVSVNLDGPGRDYWPYDFDTRGLYGQPDDPYEGRNPSMAEVTRTEGLKTSVFQFVSDAHFVGGSTTTIDLGDGTTIESTSEGGLEYPGGFQRSLTVTRGEGEEDAHYEGHRQDARSETHYGVVDNRGGEEIMGEYFHIYSVYCNASFDILNLSYRGDKVYADVDGSVYMKSEIRETGKWNPEVLNETGPESHPISGRQIPFTVYQDTVSGEAMMYLQAGEVTLYFWVVGVHLSEEYTYITQEDETHAEETPGEDEGSEVHPGIIEGHDDPQDGGGPQDGGNPGPDGKRKPGKVRSAIFLGLIGGGAAVIGGATLYPDDKKKAGKSRYKMYVYKDFGDVIEKGAPPCRVCARLAEIREDGKEIERPDLTEKIVPFSRDGILTVEDGGMSGKYKAAVVSAPEESEADEGTVSFRYEGAGGVYLRHVVFSLSGVEICFTQENLGLAAHIREPAELWFAVVNAPDNVKVTAKMVKPEAPYTVEVSQDAGHPQLCCASIRDFLHYDEQEAGTTEVWPMRVRAEWTVAGADGKPVPKTKEKDFDVVRVFMGLTLQLEGDGIGCYLNIKPGAMEQARVRAAGTSLGLDLADIGTALNPAAGMIGAGTKAMYRSLLASEVRPEDLEPCVTVGNLLLLYWNEEERQIERIAVTPEADEQGRYRFPVQVTALRVESDRNAVISKDPSEDHQRMVRELQLVAFPTNVLDKETGARRVKLCATRAELDKPIRLWSEISLSARYKGETYTVKKKVLLHSMPVRSYTNETERMHQLGLDERIRQALERMRTEIWEHYMRWLSSLYYLAGRMIDGYDDRFGYDPAQLERVIGYWNDFRQGKVVGKNGESYKPTIDDDLAACVAFLEGMRDNGGIIGRIALGVCTGGYSEVVFFGLELHQKMKAEVFACKGKEFGFWDGVELGVKEYSKVLAAELVIGGTLHGVNSVIGRKTGIDALATISSNWRAAMDGADKALRGSSKTYRGAAQALESIQAFGTGGVREYKNALERAAAEEEALAQNARNRPEYLNLSPREMKVHEEAMQQLRDYWDAQQKLAIARKQGPEALAEAQKAFDDAYKAVIENKNAFDIMKYYEGSQGMTMRAKFAETRQAYEQRIMDNILDEVCAEKGWNRNEVYIEKISGHADQWKELAGLTMPKDVDMRVVHVDYSSRGGNLVASPDAVYSRGFNDVTLDRATGQRSMYRNVYKEYHGGAEALSPEAAKEYASLHQDWSYVEGPILGTEGKWELDYDLEAFADLNIIDPSKAGTELNALELNKRTLQHKSMEWYNKGEKKWAEAEALERQAGAMTGAEQEAALAKADALYNDAIAAKSEAIYQLQKAGKNQIAPRAEYRQGKGQTTKWSSLEKEIVEQAAQTKGGVEAFETYLKTEHGMSFEQAVEQVTFSLE